MERGSDTVKGLSVARIASKQSEEGGVGIYHSQMVDNVLSPLIKSEKYFAADKETEAELLDKYGTNPKWSMRIEFYELSMDGELTQSEIADRLSAKHNRTIRQGYVSEAIGKVRSC
jgi:hypothetical protein